MKVGDYVACKRFPNLHGTIAEVGSPLVRVKLFNGSEQEFFPSHLIPKERPFALSASGLGADVDDFAQDFYERHKSGTKVNDLYQIGSTTRQFMGFCEFLKIVQIA